MMISLHYFKTTPRFAARLNGNARMAELVDALVSNTSAFTGMPVRARLRVQNLSEMRGFFIFAKCQVFIFYIH